MTRTTFVTFFLVLFIFAGCINMPEHQTENIVDHDTLEIGKFAEEYSQNELAANERYTGKNVTLLGYVGKVGVAIGGDKYVIIRSASGNIYVQCFLDERAADIAKNLNLATLVYVTGVSKGYKTNNESYKADFISMEDCTVGIYVEKPQEMVIQAETKKDDRAQILDAVRVPVERELKQPVKFVVNKLIRCGNWALLFAIPVKPKGNPIDYKNTDYQEMIDDGAFDEGVMALLTDSNGSWHIMEYTMGGTDTPTQEWILKHKLETCASQFGVNL